MVIAHRPTSALADDLFSARTAADVERLIAGLEHNHWPPYGKNGNNYGPVNIGGDPIDALVEKITNGMDGILERLVHLAGRTDLESPRAAADQLLNVPRGHVEYLHDREKRRALAECLTVTMRDSGCADEPTIVVQDRGIGQHPDDFPSTLVSLNEENKRDKFYLMGAYGWGGAAALAHCEYMIFVSRRDPALLDGRPDEVGWTIVRYNDLAEERASKTGVYQYLAVEDGAGNIGVPRFSAVDLPADWRDWHGTICTMIAYQIGRPTARSASFLGQKSLRNVCNAVLFDPVMPFLVAEEREKYVKKNVRNANGVIVVGNAARLAELASKRQTVGDDGDDTESREVGVVHHDVYRATLSDGGGTAMVRYWVMDESLNYKKDWEPARNYVPRDQAVTLSLNGQRHAAWAREFFEEQCGYTTLAKALVVQVDADDLHWREKRALFATSRDKLKGTEVARRLRDEVKAALRTDDWLRSEERRRREHALGRQSKEQAERIQRMLAKAIKAYRDGDVDIFKKVMSSNPQFPLLEDQPLLDEGPSQAAPVPGPDPVEYQGEPTFVRVLNNPVHVPAGGRTVVRLQVDAPDDYFDSGHGDFMPIITRGGDVFKIEGYSSLRHGIMRCTLSAKGASAGDKGRIVFTVTRGEALPIADDADIQVDEPLRQRVKPAGKQPGKEQGPPVLPCYREEWPIYEFDENTVARIIPEPGDPSLYTIRVNWDYAPLDATLRAEKKVDVEVIESYKERFVASMGFLAWLQRQQNAPVSNDELARAAQVHLFSVFLPL